MVLGMGAIACVPMAHAGGMAKRVFSRANAPYIAAENVFGDGAGFADARRAGAAGIAPAIPIKNSHFDGNYIIAALGVAWMPEYEGSSFRKPSPAFGIQGRIGQVSFSPRSAGLALDFWPDRAGRRMRFGAGPVVLYHGGRGANIRDPLVARLGPLAGTVEAGLAMSVARQGIWHSSDSISIGGDLRWDVSGHHGGMIFAPSLSYRSPVSRGVLVGGSVSAEVVSTAYARYYYSISPFAAAASGLPTYQAHGGVKSLSAQGFVAVDLGGDFTDGGFAMLLGGNYARLMGSAAETPIVRLRGDRDQWTYGAGLAYDF
jgi:outer membrane scaffolding protein for murein synthesis (MipA/OmpV family)